jgi:hypothetical protein
MKGYQMQIVIKVPDKFTPGFARRLHRAAGFQERVKVGEFSAKLVEEMVDFLADYIEGDKTEAKEYLWDCTEVQFQEMIGAVAGGSTEQIPPPKSEPSAMP